MTEPQEKSEDNAQRNSDCEKPACLRERYKTNKKQTNNNHQFDGMASPKPCSATAEGNDFVGMRYAAVRGVGNSVAMNTHGDYTLGILYAPVAFAASNCTLPIKSTTMPDSHADWQNAP